MSEKSNPTRGEPLESQSNGSDSTPAERVQGWPWSSAAGQAVEERWSIAKSPWTAAQGTVDASGRQEGIRAGRQQEGLGSRGDKKVLMTRIEIGLEQLLNQFAKGDRYARRDLMEYADKLGIDFLAKHRQALEEALTPNYQAILDAYLRAPKRRRKRCAGPACVGAAGTPG